MRGLRPRKYWEGCLALFRLLWHRSTCRPARLRARQSVDHRQPTTYYLLLTTYYLLLSSKYLVVRPCQSVDYRQRPQNPTRREETFGTPAGHRGTGCHAQAARSKAASLAKPPPQPAKLTTTQEVWDLGVEAEEGR